MSEVRLIDANALKKLLVSSYYCTDRANPPILDYILGDIDNAPSVPLPDFKTGYRQAIIDGKTNFSRPQGNWVLVHPLQEDDEGAYMCSECHSGDWRISTEFKFCPYCGAEMQNAEK